MHLDFTFEGLGFHFLDTCPIKASLSRPTEVFSCVATIHGHFAINAVRQVVAMHLMRREWLFCPFFFLCSLFKTELPSSPRGLHQGSFIPNSRPSRGQVGTLGIVISEIIPNPLLVKRVLSSDLLSLPPLTTFDPCPPTDNISICKHYIIKYMVSLASLKNLCQQLIYPLFISINSPFKI